MSDNGVSIKITLKTYQELILRKIDSGVPITKQIDKLVFIKGMKNGKKPAKR